MMLALALKVLTPVIVGFVTPFVLDALKRASAWLDAAPVFVKQGAAIAIAAAATTIGHAIQVGSLPTDLASWDQQTVEALVAGVLAIAVKQHQQLTRKRA